MKDQTSIKNIGIIGGTNGMGKSFADYFTKKFGNKKKIWVSGRKTKISNKDIFENCDLVIFSVPISQTKSVIESGVSLSRLNQIWVDFTSVKGFPVESMLKGKASVCGMHPLFGNVLEMAGKKIVYTPNRINTKKLQLVLEVFEDFEMIQSTPKEHDEMMGMVQNLSHFSDFVLAKTLKDSQINFKKMLGFTSPPYRIKLKLLARIFAQNPKLYAEISCYNRFGRNYENKFLKAAEFFQTAILEKNITKIEAEFQEVAHFLGSDFCEEQLEKSKSILHLESQLEQESLLSEAVSKKNEPEVVQLFEEEAKNNILEKTKNQTSKIDWAIFSAPYSHTDEASFNFRKKSDSVLYFHNFFEVFEAVQSGQAKKGIVPYENSRQGSVFEVLDELFENQDIKITEAKEVAISQNLLGLQKSEIKNIKKILSHTQALAQSRSYLKKNLPKAIPESVYSTAFAGVEIQRKNDQSLAAIGSELMAKSLHLKILASNIQEFDNKTRFVVLEKVALKDLSPNKKNISFVFWFAHNKSGNLAQVLTFLADQKIDLLKLDSRRAGAEYGNYLFFIDAKISKPAFEKNIQSPIENLCGGLKILGVF